MKRSAAFDHNLLACKMCPPINRPSVHCSTSWRWFRRSHSINESGGWRKHQWSNGGLHRCLDTWHVVSCRVDLSVEWSWTQNICVTFHWLKITYSRHSRTNTVATEIPQTPYRSRGITAPSLPSPRYYRKTVPIPAVITMVTAVLPHSPLLGHSLMQTLKISGCLM